jgi:hypothetical protein
MSFSYLRLAGSAFDMYVIIEICQSRVAKLEAAESKVSLDLLFLALFATGVELRFRTLAPRGLPRQALVVLDNVGATFAKGK